MGIAFTLMTALVLQASAPSSQAAPAIAPPETVREFLAAADALVALGEGAAASPQADALRLSVQDAAIAYRAALAESAQRGEAQRGCPPPPGQAQLSLGDLIGDFQAFPDAHRDMPVATAFALVMTLRYPCETARK